MLNKILAQFQTTLNDLENFVISETRVCEDLKESMKTAKLNIKNSSKDIAKAKRVRTKLTNFIE